MASVRISRELITAAMQSQATRDGLSERARKVAGRVDVLGQSEGVTMDAYVTEGTRPKGRPYARVNSENVSQEWGSRDVERRRIMGRVSAESRSK